jgi:hypothetical protein
MTKAGQTILLQRKHMQWIAIGVFTDVAPLVAAGTELTSAGLTLADLCLAAAPASIQRLAAAPEVRSVDCLAALVNSVVEVRLPGSEAAIAAAPSCFGNPGSLFSSALAEGLRGPIIDGCILLGAIVAGAADASRVGRILLGHSSRRVHLLQCPCSAREATAP